MTLQRYILRQLVIAFGAALGTLGLLFFPPLAISATTRVGGAAARVLLGYVPYLAVETFPYVVPMAFLLAVVSTYGRLSTEGEWTAIRMAGIHPLRSLAPVLVVAALLGAGSLRLLRCDFPALRFTERTYRQEAALSVLRDGFPGRTGIQAGEFSLLSARRNGDVFEDVVIRLPARPNADAVIVVADRARLSADATLLSIELDGMYGTLADEDFALSSASLALPLHSLFPKKQLNRESPKVLTTADIRAHLEQHVLPAELQRELAYEAERRDALASSFVLFALLGTSVGLRLRRDGIAGPLAATALLGSLYYILAIRAGEQLVLGWELPAVLGAWTPVALAAIGGAFALARVLRA